VSKPYCLWRKQGTVTRSYDLTACIDQQRHGLEIEEADRTRSGSGLLRSGYRDADTILHFRCALELACGFIGADMTMFDVKMTAQNKTAGNCTTRTARQTTLKDSIRIDGIGVHSGNPSSIVLHPAKSGSGITFLRKSDGDAMDQLIPAHVDNVGDTRLCTVLGNPEELYVATVEHLLAALRGMNVDNVLVEIDAAEVPVMDGSSRPFVDAIRKVGTTRQSAPRRYIRVLREVNASHGQAHAVLRPHDGTRFDVEIDFESPAIGRQRFIADLTPEVFAKDISRARTFGFLAEAKQLRAMGLAQGSSFDNSVVIDDDRVLNEGGLRYEDEFVRHKLLDAIGDLALAGSQLLGEYKSVCGGHKLNSMILEALFADQKNWCYEDAASAEQPMFSAPVGAPVGLEAASQPVAAAKA